MEQTQTDRLKILERGLPSLGDPSKRYPVELTEPEINAMLGGVAFILSVCKEAQKISGPFAGYIAQYLAHYGPTLEQLSEKLAGLDD